MTQFLTKWFRKFHRWIAVPTALLIPAAVVIKLLGSPEIVAAWERLDKLPSILMLVMAISGTYLFLLPYIVKASRSRKRAAAQPAKTAPALSLPVAVRLPAKADAGPQAASDNPAQAQ